MIFAIVVCCDLGLPLLVFGFHAWTRGRQYVLSRVPVLAVYCAMPIAIEAAGRFGMYGPLAGIPLLVGPPITIVLIAPKKITPEPRGFEVNPPDERQRL